MADIPESSRPVPRWLHLSVVSAVGLAFVLLLFGQLVTSFKAGMADPVWPTEPWYVFGTASEQEKKRFQEDFGFFVEHSHRILGFSLGAVMSVFALVLWWQDRSSMRWLGLVGVALMIAGYAELHRDLIGQQEAAKARQMELTTAKVPFTKLAVALIGFVLAMQASVAEVWRGTRGGWLRLLAVVGLSAVMVQGLLGGTRVALNALAGTDLATFHGIFAHVVVGLLVTLAVLTARPAAPVEPNRRLQWWSIGLAALLFVQLVWGALIRHQPDPLTQRLHLLTAFAATAAVVWVLWALLEDPAARARVRLGCYAIAGLLVVQLYLGVEAWMDRFAAYKLPELVEITKVGATFRTLHALIGSALLATSVGMAIRLLQKVVTTTNAAGCSIRETDSAGCESEIAQTPVAASLRQGSADTLEATRAASTPGDAT